MSGGCCCFADEAEINVPSVSTQQDRRYETTTNRKSVKNRSSDYIGSIPTSIF